MQKKIKILFVTYPSVGLNIGGFQIQIKKTESALKKLNVETIFFNPWINQIPLVDIIHIFSLNPCSVPFCKASKNFGKPIVVSSVFGANNTSPNLMRMQVKLSRKVPGIFSILKQMDSILHSADCVLPLSVKERDILEQVFGISPDKIQIIPNGVDSRFGEASKKIFVNKYKWEDFVLCVGRIEENKNQLSLINACMKNKQKLVIIGSPNSGENEYYKKCLNAANENIKFIGHLDNDDPMLASAYSAARIFALVSFSEVMPLSVLEAVLAKCNIVLTSNSSMSQILGNPTGVFYSSPAEDEIAFVLRKAKSQTLAKSLREKILNDFTWDSVGKEIKTIYESLL